jgi:hypothetical protein
MWRSTPVRAFLKRLGRAAAAGRVRLTVKATDEIRDHGWDTSWALDLIASLTAEDFERCEDSTVFAGDILWVFCPEIDDGTLWIRLTEREGIVVVSFHLAGEP